MGPRNLTAKKIEEKTGCRILKVKQTSGIFKVGVSVLNRACTQCVHAACSQKFSSMTYVLHSNEMLNEYVVVLERKAETICTHDRN